MKFQLKEKRIRFGGQIYTISRKMMLCGAGIGICLCILFGTVLKERAQKVPIAAVSTPSGTPPVREETPTRESEVPCLLLHVAGAVKNPGLIRVPPDARIADAIAAAGGITQEADPESLNLALPVSDGMKLYVPRSGETPAVQTPTATESVPSARINLNTAGIPELTTLNGIGESTAKKIVAYRETHGKFQKVEDLLHVSGIGAAKYEAIRDRICV